MTDEAATRRAIGERLRQWRTAAGMKSRQELADALSVPEGTLKNHEEGRSTPKAGQLLRLAQMGCDLNWLISGVGLAPGDQHQVQQQSVSLELDEDLLRVVVEMIEAWLERHAAYLPPAKKADLIAEAYALCAEDPAEEAAAERIVPRLLRLVA